MAGIKRSARERFLDEVDARFDAATAKLRRLAELGDPKKFDASDDEVAAILERFDAEVAHVRASFVPRRRGFGFGE